MLTPEVEGATGYLDTNFEGKAAAAIEAFKNGYDLAYLHFEAPDECGHRGEAENKVKAIEVIDRLALKPCLQYLEGCGEDFRILIMPDHPTPLRIRTHSIDPVPFFIYASDKIEDGVDSFSEDSAAAKGNYIPNGYTLMDHLIQK